MAIFRTPLLGQASRSLDPSLNLAEIPAGRPVLLGLLDHSTAALLDLHEGIWDSEAPEPADQAVPSACERWPKLLRLHSSGGLLVPGRCRSTRLCDYCAKLEAVEISELLALDAMDGRAPEIYAVLTTRSVSTDPADFYASRKAVLKALKRLWPTAEYCCITEFTTGRAGTSGGKRRVHFNLLLKGIPAADAEAACALMRRVWCDREDAEPWAQYAAPVTHEGGLLRYLALHFLKESQRPPQWWHGHRVTRSRGYLSLPSWQARARAKASLRLKRALRAALIAGHDPAEALVVAELAILKAEQIRWTLVTIEVNADGELTGMTPTLGGAMRGPKYVAPRPVTLTLDEEHELAAMRLPGYVAALASNDHLVRDAEGASPVGADVTTGPGSSPGRAVRPGVEPPTTSGVPPAGWSARALVEDVDSWAVL